MRLLWITAGSVALFTFLFSVAVEWLGFPIIYNSGVAFGLRLPEPFQTLLIVVALTVVVRLGIVARRQWETFGYGCIIGGACANIADRLIDGMVTDMFRIGSFPLFNAADAAITFGVVVIVWVQGREMLFTK